MEHENEIRDEEVVTVELGQEGEVKSVEEEIADATPTEAPTEAVVEEEPSEEPTEAPSEEPTEKPDEQKEGEVKDKDSSSDTTSSENPSAENEPDESEKTEEAPTEPPTDEEEKEPSVDEALEKAKAELEELREAEATRKIVEKINQTAIEVENEVARFDNSLSKALEDTFKQYDIDLNTTLDELKEKDPAKHAIAMELIGHAENIRAQKIAEMQAPLIQAQKDYVFREASKVMCTYEMTEEQAQEAANTFVNIMNNVGIADVGEDLKAKVELAVARAKMIIPKVENVVKEVKEIVEDTKEAVKDVIAEKAPEEEKSAEESVQEVVEEAPSETPTEAPTEAPTANLEAFKEGAAEGDAIVNNREGITVDNVLGTLSSLPFKARTEFYKKYSDLIREAGIQQFKRQGLQ